MKFLALFVLLTSPLLAQTTYKGKTYTEAKVLGYDSQQKFCKGTSHSKRVYQIQVGKNTYSVERHGYTNGDLMAAVPGDVVYVFMDGKKMSVLAKGKESKYVIVGVKPAE